MAFSAVAFFAPLAPAVAAGAEATESIEPKRFNFVDVRRRAAALAAKPFQTGGDSLPAALKELDYDQYREIRFRPEKAVWRDDGLPFELQFFHRGLFFLRRVTINIVDQGVVKPITYSPDLFDYGKTSLTELPADLGFAGFRVHFPLHRDNYYDEVAVFLGASYFRAVGQNQSYGISARGLAIDTGLNKQEEFPFFKEFWIQRPDPDATELTVFALLDSESATGAYRYVIRPGAETTLTVKATVFMRNAVEKLGIAPLTSMFLHGENTARYSDDFRPEVHDSDGLLLALGSGEWLWRPLNNPRHLRISSFGDENPRGFGLRQRDRNFDSYQDLEAAYQRRPSTWIAPIGNWGKGVVELIEIPSDAEWHDNMLAFWKPEGRIEAGQEWEVEYRVHFAMDQADLPPGGKTLATRIGAGGTGEVEAHKRKFVIDFGGGPLEELDASTPVEAVVSASQGNIRNKVVQYNEFTRGWRVFFEIKPSHGKPVELRCFLKTGNDVLTETWSYQWMPP